MKQIELQVVNQDGRVVLTSPEVGWFTCAAPQGQVLSPGASAGSLRSLDRSFELVVPQGISGRVINDRPERVHEPVGYGTTLYELAPLDAQDTLHDEDTSPATTAGAPTFLAPHSGRFWQRPTPSDPPFVEVGAVIDAGQTIGLIEVMKTFTHLAYTPGAHLPGRARVTRLCVGDGAEVTEGEALLEVEPA